MSGCHNPDYAPIPQKTDMQIVAERLDEIQKSIDAVVKITNHLTQVMDDHDERINELEEGDDY